MARRCLEICVISFGCLWATSALDVAACDGDNDGAVCQRSHMEALEEQESAAAKMEMLQVKLESSTFGTQEANARPSVPSLMQASQHEQSSTDSSAKGPQNFPISPCPNVLDNSARDYVGSECQLQKTFCTWRDGEYGECAMSWGSSSYYRCSENGKYTMNTRCNVNSDCWGYHYEGGYYKGMAWHECILPCDPSSCPTPAPTPAPTSPTCECLKCGTSDEGPWKTGTCAAGESKVGKGCKDVLNAQGCYSSLDDYACNCYTGKAQTGR